MGIDGTQVDSHCKSAPSQGASAVAMSSDLVGISEWSKPSVLAVDGTAAPAAAVEGQDKSVLVS